MVRYVQVLSGMGFQLSLTVGDNWIFLRGYERFWTKIKKIYTRGIRSSMNRSEVSKRKEICRPMGRHRNIDEDTGEVEISERKLVNSLHRCYNFIKFTCLCN